MREYTGKGHISEWEAAQLKALLPFATLTQAEVIEAVVRHQNYQDAADELSMSRAALLKRIQRVKKTAARRGVSPEHDMTEGTPEGFSVKGVSTYYRVNPETGKKEARGQWVKTKQEEQDRLELLMEAIRPLADDLTDKSEFIPAPEHSTVEDLLCVYPMGDPHIGMHAWAEETGDRNFNLKIAERNLMAAVNHLVNLAPAAETGIALNLGDFFHADNLKSTTAKGTPVDVDGRITKVLETGVRVMVNMVKAMLRKHQKVEVYCVIGNHDTLMATVLAVCLAQYFNNNPRVTVETRPRLHYYYEFGRCLIGMHHGHAARATDLAGIMAVDMAEAWGRSKFRHWYCGHIHHDKVREFPGVTVEAVRTLAPADAWHSGKYRSGSDMKMDVWHRNYGPINRHIVGIEAVMDAVGSEDD